MRSRACPSTSAFRAPPARTATGRSRAAAASLAPLYVPEAVVVHHQQLEAAGFVRQQYRYGRGAVLYRRAGSGRPLAPLRFYAGLLRRGFAEGPAVGALVAASQLLVAAGAAAERLAPRR